LGDSEDSCRYVKVIEVYKLDITTENTSVFEQRPGVIKVKSV